MRDHLIIYKYPTGLIDELRDFHSNIVATWSDGETLMKREGDVGWHGNKDIRHFIRKKLRENDDFIASMGSFEETDTRVEFDDICDYSDTLTDIMKEESPGGDIRKYTTDIYGGFETSINFNLFKSKESTITGFEPISMNSVERMMSMDFCNNDLMRDSRYPTPRKILVWSDLLTERFDVKCGATGAIHWRDDDIRAGFDGFAIYGPDDQVDQFIRSSWFTEDNGVFMCPHEYDMYEPDDIDFLDRSIIRMWWD